MTKLSIPPFERPPVRLRLINDDDLPLTLEWRNLDHIRKWFTHSDIITPEQHRAWYEKYLLRENDFLFIIEEITTLNRPVGQTSLYNIDWETKHAEYGRLMIGDPEARGRGLAKLTAQMVNELAFTQLGLEEIVIEVMKENTVSIAVHAAIGYQTIGEKDDYVIMIVRKDFSHLQDVK